MQFFLIWDFSSVLPLGSYTSYLIFLPDFFLENNGVCPKYIVEIHNSFH